MDRDIVILIEPERFSVPAMTIDSSFLDWLSLTCSFIACAVQFISTRITPELDGFGFVANGSFVCGYLRFKTGWLCSVFERSNVKACF